MAKHDEHLGHLLWETFARVHASCEALFENSELTRPSLGVLDVIATTPGISIAEIARRSPKTQQAVSQVVARLETLGFLERRLLTGRTIGLYLTTAGTKARADGNAIEVRFEKELEDILGRERYERLRKALMDARPILVEHADRLTEPPRSSSPSRRSSSSRRAR